MLPVNRLCEPKRCSDPMSAGPPALFPRLRITEKPPTDDDGSGGEPHDVVDALRIMPPPKCMRLSIRSTETNAKTRAQNQRSDNRHKDDVKITIATRNHHRIDRRSRVAGVDSGRRRRGHRIRRVAVVAAGTGGGGRHGAGRSRALHFDGARRQLIVLVVLHDQLHVGATASATG